MTGSNNEVWYKVTCLFNTVLLSHTLSWMSLKPFIRLFVCEWLGRINGHGLTINVKLPSSPHWQSGEQFFLGNSASPEGVDTKISALF